MTALSLVDDGLLIVLGIFVLLAVLAWIFERLDQRNAKYYEQRARQDAEQLIADANADLFQRPRVRALSAEVKNERNHA